jgi:malate synthase
VTTATVEVLAPADEEVLSREALDFVALLHRELNPTRLELLEGRRERQARLDAGERPSFLEETRDLREDHWQVAEAPADLRDRRCEITGPVDRKMMINALNSGARVFMADFEDSLSPTFANVVEGQRNVYDAVRGTISLETPKKTYRLDEEMATLMIRPRGWHLPERHVLVEGEPVSAGLFDFGLTFFHNAREQLERGSGPYFYLPKLESRLEARLWAETFALAEDALELPHGSIRSTVLIETILAAFEMEEILFELRDYGCSLNAGRWDYIFSVIKKLGAVLPDRAQVTMAVPFMRAYTQLLVRSCHRRGAHAIGGFDGTWVAHPDLVPVATEVFDDVLGDRPNQVDRLREDVAVAAEDLTDFTVPEGTITEDGLRVNVSVGTRYLDAWLSGVGAAAIDNLMEDAATAEISRAQVWSWLRDGRFTEDDVRAELASVEAGQDAKELFAELAFAPRFVEFLTLPAYERLD